MMYWNTMNGKMKEKSNYSLMSLSKIIVKKKKNEYVVLVIKKKL